MLSQFDFPELDRIQPQDIVITSTDPDCQDFIDCTNEPKLAAEKINKKPRTCHETAKNVNDNAHYLDKKLKQRLISNIVSTKDDGASNKNNFAKKQIEPNQNSSPQVGNLVSPKHFKRKIINLHFDQESKRKFPGPAGLLTGVLEEAKDESIAQIEFLSQVIKWSSSATFNIGSKK